LAEGEGTEKGKTHTGAGAPGWKRSFLGAQEKTGKNVLDGGK